MNLSADDAAFDSDFGGDITVDGVAARGILDEGYSEIGGFGVQPPSINCSAAVVADEGSTVVLGADGRTFEVSLVEPDGTGRQKLVLRKV